MMSKLEQLAEDGFGKERVADQRERGQDESDHQEHHAFYGLHGRQHADGSARMLAPQVAFLNQLPHRFLRQAMHVLT